MLRICCKYLTSYIYLRLMRNVSIVPLCKFILPVNYLIFSAPDRKYGFFIPFHRFLSNRTFKKQLRMLFMALSLVEGLSCGMKSSLEEAHAIPTRKRCEREPIIDPENHEASTQVLLLFRGWKHIFSHNTLLWSVSIRQINQKIINKLTNKCFFLFSFIALMFIRGLASIKGSDLEKWESD